MPSRLELAGAIAAVLVTLAVLGMHAVDAHPADELQTHGHSAVVPLTPPVEQAVPVALATPSAGHEMHTHHGVHAATPVPEPAPEPGAPLATEPNRTSEHSGHGHSDAFAHHVAMCSAVILAGLAAAFGLRRPRRISPLAVRRLIGTPLSLDPPVPRLAFALS